MVKKKRVCKGCGNESYIWSKNLCKTCFHKLTPQKPIKKSYLSKKPSEKQVQKNIEKKAWLEELHNWELKLFDKQKDERGYCYCFETGTPMHESVYRHNLCIYSHCYPKSKYKWMAMYEWNVLIVLPSVHTQWESDRSKTPKMLEYYNSLEEFVKNPNKPIKL